MSDETLRALERRRHETGAVEDVRPRQPPDQLRGMALPIVER